MFGTFSRARAASPPKGGPQINHLPRNSNVDKILNKLLSLQSVVDEKQELYDTHEKLSERKIIPFQDESVGNVSMFDTKTGGKRSASDEFDQIEPKALYASRLLARQQLASVKEDLEYAQMEEAEFVFQLQKQCQRHQFVIFNDPSIESKVGVDIYSLRCLTCFKPIQDLSRAPQTVNMYPTKMSFDKCKQLRYSQVSSLQPLY